MSSVRPLLSLIAFFTALSAACHAAPVISEFMASNRQTLADSDGDFSDWIEIHNPDSAPVDLTGWYLTDAAARKTKWQFPAVRIPANGYLVVFASDKNRRDPAGPLHTNFALSADGEYLGLVAADGTTVVSEYAPSYPSQSPDRSYGVSAGGAIGVLQTPTPGAANTLAVPSVVTLARADGGTDTFSTTLPVLVLDNHGFGAQERAHGEIEGSVQLFAGGTTFASPAGVSVRGSSSAEFPKKSYSIELHDDTGANRSASLLGMAKNADWALVSAWDYDRSHLRNAFLYSLSNSIGLWAPQTRFVEVFFKGDGAALSMDHYYGVAALTERIKIDTGLVNIQSLSASDISGDAVTGGYIVKIDPPDDDEFSWVTNRGLPEGIDGGTSLVVASPKAAKLAPEQRDYIQGYFQAFEDALYADRDSNWATRDYLGYIDRASWVDFHLLQVLSKNPDGLARSTYFTKDRGGKLKAGPIWDFDRAMGSIDPRSETWDEWFETTDASQLWERGWWGVMASDPDFMQAWIDRWQDLRRGALASERISALVGTLAGQIEPAAAARDAERWPDNVSRYGDHRGEVEHLASWLVQRASWIDRQFIAPPVVAEINGSREIRTPAGLMIAYTLDGTDPRGSGGGVAASAVLVANALTIPAGSTITARIFDPSGAAPAIGSAWSSSVVATAEAAAVVENGSAQLANLSTHAVLTGGAKLGSSFVVPGTAPQTLVVRAVGRTLAALGVSGVLLDPVLTVYASDGSMVASNANWQSGADVARVRQVSAAAGAFPLAEETDLGRDAVLALTLAPGRYTAEIASESGAGGLVLAEIYAAAGASNLKYVAVRGALGAGEALISGLTITGTDARTVLIRAVGGDADAKLSVYRGNRLLGVSDDWGYAANAGEIVGAAMRANVAPLALGARDAAVLLRLTPGVYTLRAGANFSAPGGVLLEVVELP